MTTAFKDWHLENSRTARWHRPDLPVQGIVIDPTVVVSLSCFSRFRKGIEWATRSAQLFAPLRIEDDLLLLASRLESSGTLSRQGTAHILKYLDDFPIALVNPDHSIKREYWLEHRFSPQMIGYLATAKQKSATILTFDPDMIRAARQLRIPRYRFVARHRLTSSS